MSHSKRSRVGRLPRWQRWSTHIAFLVCALSGIIYFSVHTLHWGEAFVPAYDTLRIHGLSTYFVLMGFGAVLPGHIRAAWNAKRNRNTGIAMIVLMAALAVSGLGLYYGSEEMRDAVLWLHWIIAAVIIGAFPLHLILGRRANVHR